MKIAKDITDLIGRTPLVQLNKIPQAEKVGARIVVKLESMNPACFSKRPYRNKYGTFSRSRGFN